MNAWDHYSDSTESHFARFEGFRFWNVHRSFLRFLPKQGGRCLDVGAGSGRDAAAMADRGLRVIAVEPSDAFLRLARSQHVHKNLTWIQDALPSLSKIVQRYEKYDFILMSAVWMHLQPFERTPALATLSSLLNKQGYLAITLRIGNAEPERSIYEVSIQDLLIRAFSVGLCPVYIGRISKDSLNRSEIRWVKVVLGRNTRD
ncbi:2-polyprenyl-3-methyl-5-hydroxy-6-metoxy-1,4-benzoquinol methylase [Undibacterium sp. GrIS 1.2]|uniref:class I SAM-dependent methyltransferase n=1 Tax=Undibacterium sp. GrIS 1.2 TaxID=3143933 RepID=UPI0033956A7D